MSSDIKPCLLSHNPSLLWCVGVSTDNNAEQAAGAAPLDAPSSVSALRLLRSTRMAQVLSPPFSEICQMTLAITAVNTRESVRGSPGVDYPIYGMSAFSLSTFSCEDRAQGVHYADTGLGCQVRGEEGYKSASDSISPKVFHVCDTLTRTPTRISFICPNGTLYSQTKHVCDWWWR